MFSSPVNSLAILRTLARDNKNQDVARMAQVFELLLQQSRFDWLGGGEGRGRVSPVGNDWMGQQQAVLNHLAARFPAPTYPAVQGPVNKIHGRGVSGMDQKSFTETVPRSIPLLAKQAAEKHGIPSKLFRRLIWVESEFNPKAISPKGAMGLGQLMPETARELGLSLETGEGQGTVWDPASNLDASARYLKWLHGVFMGKGIGEKEAWRFSAAAYNAGIGNISKAIDKAGEGEDAEWRHVARHLPSVTGRASAETFNYLARLRL